jgi:phosphate transport system substrate-binding protein
MKEATSNAKAAVAAVALAALLAASCGRQQGGGGGQSLAVRGSDTMVHLTGSWAEAFMEGNPDVEVAVTGGGSGTGIAALLNGTTDICAASRAMQPNEQDLARQKGIEPVEFVVARDGIALIVNPANPVASLTLEQIRNIYTGACTSWKEVGGPDEQIIVLSRESSSGTYVFFQEHVLKKQDYRQDARLMPATAAIIQSVSDDKWSIGYVGLGYAREASEKVKTLPVQADAAAPRVMPSEETVRSGEYSIARPLYLYTSGPPQGAVKEFVDFCLGTQGQRIVRQTGYVTVK